MNNIIKKDYYLLIWKKGLIIICLFMFLIFVNYLYIKFGYKEEIKAKKMNEFIQNTKFETDLVDINESIELDQNNNGDSKKTQ